MITDAGERRRVIEAFPFLRSAPAAFHEALFERAVLARLPAGQRICHEGADCAQLPLILSGVGRVFKLGENGREMTLYRIMPGESCVVTASCILSRRPFPAFAECERPVEALVVRPSEVHAWVATSEAWREYLFGLIASRLHEVFGVLDAVLFQRLDQRLIAYLLRAQAETPGAPLRLTHQSLAIELGSSREVISRILKGLETQGMIGMTRGRIRLLDVPALTQRASEP